MKTPFLSGGQIILEVKDYNEIYDYIRFCNMDYQGDIDKSKYFYLRPKEMGELKESIPIKSEKGKHKNKWYIPAYNIGFPNYDCERIYLSDKFTQFLKL